MSSIPILRMALVGCLPSPLKVAYYRWKGARIGRGVRIGLFSVLLADDISIGDGTRIGPLSFIRCRRLVIGNRSRIASLVAIDTNEVVIGHDTVLMEQTVIGGMKTPRSRIHIGSRVKVFPYSFLNPTEPIVIEDEVGIGGANYLFTHGSWQPVLDGFPIGFGPITLRKGVWLPWRVFILPGVEVGEYSTIGAGAVINKSIPPRSLAVGAPAKVISADGAHLRPLGRLDRQQKVKEILAEMLEFMAFEGADVQHDASASAWRALLRMPAGPSQTLAYMDESVIEAPAGDVVIGFDAIGDAMRDEFQSRGVTWFDIERRECSLGNSGRADDVRNYFSRYGVRFAVVGEPDVS
jgi:acetyltransferase-like isoleucine patch superfamily enzyme